MKYHAYWLSPLIFVTYRYTRDYSEASPRNNPDYSTNIPNGGAAAANNDDKVRMKQELAMKSNPLFGVPKSINEEGGACAAAMALERKGKEKECIL